MKVLVTGFECFGNDLMNPSSLLLEELNQTIHGAQIETLVLPVVRYASIEKLKQQVLSDEYDIVLCIGQAAGRSAMSVERIGINLDDYRIEDNAHQQPIDEVIMEDGAAAYFSDLPIKAMVEASRQVEVAAMVSNSAGTYVCNHVLYGAGYLKERYHLHYRFGFVHVPCLKEQAMKQNLPYLSLTEMKRSIEVMIAAAITVEQDLVKSEGVEC